MSKSASCDDEGDILDNEFFCSAVSYKPLYCYTPAEGKIPIIKYSFLRTTNLVKKFGQRIVVQLWKCMFPDGMNYI